jgi:hypothetical protein
MGDIKDIKVLRKLVLAVLGRIFGTALGAYGGYNLGHRNWKFNECSTYCCRKFRYRQLLQKELLRVSEHLILMLPLLINLQELHFKCYGSSTYKCIRSTYNNWRTYRYSSLQPQFQQLEPSITNAAYNVPDNGVLTYSDIPGEQSFSYTEPGVQQASYTYKSSNHG